MATTTETTHTAARIAQVALACVLAVTLGLPPLSPLRASAADGPAPAPASSEAPAPAQIISVVPETSEYVPGDAAPAAPAPEGDASSEPPVASDPDAPSADPDTSETPGTPVDPETPQTADPAAEAPADATADSDPAAEPEAPSLLSEAAPALLSEATEASVLSASAETVWGGVAWSVDAAGLLRLSPAAAPASGYASGQMPEVTYTVPTPWTADAAVSASVTALQVDAGVKTGKNAFRLFAGMTNLQEVRAFHLDTANATSIYELFQGCGNLAGTVDLSECNTANVKHLYGMFNNCKKLQRVNMGGAFSTASATSLFFMFRNCNALEEIAGLGSFSTSNVTSLGGMFAWCYKLKSIDVANWDVSKVTDTKQVFLQCTSLERLDLSQWNTAMAKDFFQFLYKCHALKSVKFGPNFTTGSVESRWEVVPGSAAGTPESYGSQGLSYMFYQCESLTSIDVSSFDTTNIRNVSVMFAGCTSLTSITVGSNFSWTGAWNPANTSELHYDPTYFSNMLPLNTAADFEGWRDEANPSAALYPADASGAVIPKGARTLRASFKVPEAPAENIIRNGTCGEGITWEIVGEAPASTTGQLRIRPTDGMSGTLPVVPFWTYLPWYYGTDEITSVKVYPGVVANADSSYLFSALNNIVECDVSYLDTSQVTNMSYMFFACSSLPSLDLSNFDTSQVTSMSSMFSGCEKLTSLDLSNFDTSQVTSMSSMFSGCEKLTSLDLSSFDTSKVAYMSKMFHFCNTLSSLKLSAAFDTSQVTDMSSMFCGCPALQDLDVSKFDTSQVTDMSSMFCGCPALQDLDVSKFDTSQVTNMSLMFSECRSLASLDLSSFNTSQVTDMGDMFNKCSGLGSLDLSSFNTSKVMAMSNMFGSCSFLTSVKVGSAFSFAGGGITDAAKKAVLPALSGAAPDAGDGIAREYAGTWQLAELAGGPSAAGYAPADMPDTLAAAGWDAATKGPATWTAVQKVVPPAAPVASGAFDGGGVGWYVATDAAAAAGDTPNRLVVYPTNGVRGEFTIPDAGAPWNSQGGTLRRAAVLPGCAVSAGGSLQGMFNDCSRMIDCDLAGLDASNATNMNQMFFYCARLESLDLSNLDTSKVTSMATMFGSCSSLTSLNLSSFNTSNVTSMHSMFDSCSSLTSLNLSSFNTSNVTNMFSMFRRCGKLATLVFPDVFNTSKVQPMNSMFEECSSLTSLDLSGFDTSNVTNMRQMFLGCTNLTSLDLSGFDTSKSANMFNMFSNCPKLASVKVGAKFSFAGAVDLSAGNPLVQKAVLPALSGNVAAAPGDEFARAYKGRWFLAEQGVAGKGQVYDAASVPATLAGAGWDATADGPAATWTAAAEADVPTAPAVGGPCGDGVLWDIDASGQLRVYSQVRDRVGTLPNMQSTADVPWYASRASVNTAKVHPGVAAGGGLVDMFYSCVNMTGCDLASLDTSNATNMFFMFGDCKALETLDLSNLDTSKVSNMKGLFWDCNKLATLRLPSSFATSSLTDASRMFEECNSLAELDLSGFDTSNVTDMNRMFYGCSVLKSLEFPTSFKTSNVKDVNHMFTFCRELISVDLSSFDTSNVLDMEGMFQNCFKLKSLPGLPQLDTSNVTNMRYMFMNCDAFETLDLSNFDTTKVKWMGSMFASCSRLASLDLSSFNTSKVTDMSNMFDSCPFLSSVKVGEKFSLTGNVTVPTAKAVLPALSGPTLDAGDGIAREYAGTWRLAELAAADPATPAYAPANMPDTLAAAGWDAATKGPATWTAVQKVVPPAAPVASGAFDGGVSWYVAPDAAATAGDTAKNRLVVYPADGVRGEFTIPDAGAPWYSQKDTLRRAAVLPGCAVSVGGSLKGMFQYCANMIDCDVTGLDTSSATSMASMFFGCPKLASCDVAGFNTSKATSLAGMFDGGAAITELDFSGFDTSSVTDMRGVLAGCSALLRLKLPDGFIGPKVEKAGLLFYGCSALAELPANLAIPDTLPQGERNQMFYVDPPSGVGSKLATTYAGSDIGVLTYGFEADNRALNATGASKTWDIGSPNAADVKAKLFTDGAFVVLGEGDTKSFGSLSEVPWSAQMAAIKSVTFASGVAPTDLSYWFAGATSLAAAPALPNTVTKMSSAFEGCTQLATVPPAIPATVTDMRRAFALCPMLAELPKEFTFGAEGSSTNECFYLEIPDLPVQGGNAMRYEGADARVLGYDWAGSNRRLVVGDMTGTVTIAGDAIVGGTLTASVAGAPEGAEVSWRWLRVPKPLEISRDQPIDGATAATYTPTEADYGHKLKAEATAKKGNGVYDGDAAAETATVAAPQVTAVVPEALELSMDAAGEVSAPGMQIKNAGTYGLEVKALAPRLADDGYPVGSWTLTSVPAGSSGETPASLLSAKPFLKPAEGTYALSTPVGLASGAALDLTWKAAFLPEGADALASLVAKAGGTLFYGTFEPIVAYKPPAAA